MAKLTKEEIVAALKEMTVMELNDLVKAVEEEFGVTAAVAVAASAAPAEEEEAAKGPTEVSLFIKAPGMSKVQVIKAVLQSQSKNTSPQLKLKNTRKLLKPLVQNAKLNSFTI